MLGYIVDSLTLPGTLLAVGGVFTALIRSPRTAVLALPTITYVLVLFVAARIGFLRYLMPAAFPLTLFAANAVSLAWAAERRPVRYAVAAVALLALGLGALRGLDLTHAMIVDSRHAAGDWFAENAPQGAAVQYFGPSQKLPPLRADMVTERAVPYLGGTTVYDTSDAAVREIADGWAQRRPDFIVLVPDYTSPGDAEYSSSVPPGTFAGLLEGRFGYELAGEFKSPDLLPWVKRPKLDYNLVNPPIRIFRRTSGTP